MAYSTNPITVERMSEFLTPLQGGGVVHFKVSTGKARWFSYRLREALSILQTNSNLLPEVPRDYRIEVVAHDRVSAVPKDKPTVELVVGQSPSASTMDTRPIGSIEDIISRWESHHDGGKLFFANANLTQDQLVQLYDWAVDNEVRFFENSGALTLIPASDEAAPYAWSPDDGPE